MPRTSEALRGSQWLAKGQEVVAARIDRKNGPPLIDAPDHSSHQGALKLARRIEQFWGGRVRCAVVPAGGKAIGFWAVRSDYRPCVRAA